MHNVTGVEIGLDSCVLVRVRPGADGVRVSAVQGLNDGDWDSGQTLTDSLRDLRRTGQYPRRARVVAWGAEGGPAEPLTQAAIAPLVAAGFTVEAVFSPARALLALATARPAAPSRGGEVWLALNRTAAAMAIVEGGRLLFSRVFDWNYRPAATVREELLQRYSLVAHLAPEIRHALEVVRQEHGAPVTAIVTCGDLPDLRSLTMPLIEELDMEVETLDTLDGISLEGSVAGIAADRAPALRLACAAAATARAERLEPRRLAAIAAALVIFLLGGWLLAGYLRGTRSEDSPAAAAAPAATVPQAGDRTREAPQQAPVPATAAGSAAAVSAPPSPPVPEPRGPRAAEAGDGTRPAATMGRRETNVPGPVQGNEAPPRRVARPASQVERAPLRDALPVVNSILVAPDRRLAVANGEIVREGDAIGRRVLVRIEPGALVLREPSGLEVRVPIRRKLG
jgi:hypothetical protein